MGVWVMLKFNPLSRLRYTVYAVWVCFSLISVTGMSYSQPLTDEAICPPDPYYSRDPLDSTRSVEELLFGYYADMPPVQEGATAVTTLLHIRNTTYLGRNVDRIEPNTPIELGYAAVYEGYPTEVVDVRFHVFVNEQLQVIGSEGQTALELQFLDGKMNSFNVTLPPLDTGIYDVLIAGFPNFTLPPSEPAGISEGTSVSQSMRRMTLVVGDVEWPTPLRVYEKQTANVLEIFSTDESAQALTMPPRSKTLIPSLNDRLFWWVSPNLWRPVSAGETYAFNLITQYQHYAPFYQAYGEEQRFDFALLGFEDARLLPLGAEEAALYVEMPDNLANVVAVPITLTAPEEVGQYNLVFFKIDHPRVPICRLSEVGRGDEGIEGVRVGIEVLPR